MGAALLIDITPQAGDTRELLKLIDENPGAWSAGQTLFFLSAVAWFPAGMALIRLFRREAPIGRVAGAAVAVGGLAVLPIDAAGAVPAAVGQQQYLARPADLPGRTGRELIHRARV